MFQKKKKEKGKAHAVDALDNRKAERTPRRCFKCVSEDHMIAKCPKPPKDNEERQKQVRFNEKGNRVCDKDKNNSDQKIYVFMARMSGNDFRSFEE